MPGGTVSCPECRRLDVVVALVVEIDSEESADLSLSNGEVGDEEPRESKSR